MRVLLAGLGSIGRRHAELLENHGVVEDVIAYRTGSRESSVQGLTEYFEFDEALAADPDVAFITNPTAQHVPTAIRCARAGCDLFIEKPLSHRLDGIDELRDAAAAQSLVTMVGCQLRFDPVLQAVRDRLETGSVGDVYSFDASVGSYLPDWRSETDYRDSYSASRELGGGVVLDLIHELDYVQWLFGDLTTTEAVVARISNLAIETEDVAEIACRTTTDTVGRIHLDYLRRPPRRTLEVVGSDGVIEADLNGHSLTVDRPGAEVSTDSFDYDRDERFRRQLEYFLDHVARGKACQNSLDEAKETLQRALDIRGELNG